MPSIEQVATAIRAALAEVADADRLIGAVRDRYEQAIGLLAAVTDGTDSADVSTALAALADARQRLDDARSAVSAATREVEQYLGDIGAAAGAGSASDSLLPEAWAESGVQPSPRVRQAAARLPNRRLDEESDARPGADAHGRRTVDTAGPLYDGRQVACVWWDIHAENVHNAGEAGQLAWKLLERQTLPDGSTGALTTWWGLPLREIAFTAGATSTAEQPGPGDVEQTGELGVQAGIEPLPIMESSARTPPTSRPGRR